jgi:hypothetical protein
MDTLIAAAARALAAGDALAALKLVALREDAPALALRGMAMAQIGDLERARDLLRRAERAFGHGDLLARARCILAAGEIALVLRDLGPSMERLRDARDMLDALGDRVNAAHAAYLDARRLLLIGRLDEAERMVAGVREAILPPASRAGLFLVMAGIAMRRIRGKEARSALDRAEHAARETGPSALLAEVRQARRALDAPAARLMTREEDRLLRLDEVEALLASNMLIVDACRPSLRAGGMAIGLGTRPVLFALLRALGEAWPSDMARETLLARAFKARHADPSHRARLRVEIARLRDIVAPLAAMKATKRGFRLVPKGAREVALLLPPADEDHAGLLALLADGEAWSSSALALALGVGARTVQRALEALAAAGKVQSFGRGPARRWIGSKPPGFPTSLLLPVQAFEG